MSRLACAQDAAPGHYAEETAEDYLPPIDPPAQRGNGGW